MKMRFSGIPTFAQAANAFFSRGAQVTRHFAPASFNWNSSSGAEYDGLTGVRSPPRRWVAHVNVSVSICNRHGQTLYIPITYAHKIKIYKLRKKAGHTPFPSFQVYMHYELKKSKSMPALTYRVDAIDRHRFTPLATLVSTPAQLCCKTSRQKVHAPPHFRRSVLLARQTARKRRP